MSSTRLKRCYHRCKLLKPVTDFSPNRNMRSGYASNCKPCTRDYMREYRAGETEEQRRKRLEAQRRRDADERAELDWFRAQFPRLARKKPWLEET